LEYFIMKKTLIAVAAASVLAASGIASAQTATLSGNYSFGYKHTKVSGLDAAKSPFLDGLLGDKGLKKANGKKAGFGTDDANIKFAVTEDLGGGLKVQAQVSAKGLARGTTSVEGEDAHVTLITGIGAFTFGSVESPNTIISRGHAGAPVYAFDDGLALIGGQNVDLVRYTLPVGPVTIKAAYFDGIGLGVGTQGGGERQPGEGLGVDYTNGPIDATVDYTRYEKRNSGTKVDPVTKKDVPLYPNATGGDKLKDRMRFAVSYDFGVAKIGAGIARYIGNTSKLPSPPAAAENDGVARNEFTMGVSAPFGPVTVGANYVRTTDNGIVYPGLDTGPTGLLGKFSAKVTAFSLGASYDLSKRTKVTTRFGTEKISNKRSDTQPATKINTFDMLVHHSF
jgi:predicted porin